MKEVKIKLHCNSCGVFVLEQDIRKYDPDKTSVFCINCAFLPPKEEE